MLQNVLALSVAVFVATTATAQPSATTTAPPPAGRTVTALDLEGEAFESGFVGVDDGTKIHYVAAREAGGEAVLLVPGWPQDWHAWEDLLPRLAQEGFAVVAVDPRGIGISDRPLTGYDLGRTGLDLHQVMAALGHDRYHVVGHDVGMWIGYAMASDRPDAVRTLTVMEAVVPGIAESPPLFMSQDKAKNLFHFLFNQVPDLPEELVQGREAEFLNWLFDQKGYRTDRINRDHYIELYSRPGAMRGGWAYYRAIPESMAQNAKRKQSKLPMPVLALGGGESEKSTTHDSMRAVTTTLYGGVIPGVGHYMPEEAPDEVLDQLLPLLNGKTPPTLPGGSGSGGSD